MDKLYKISIFIVASIILVAVGIILINEEKLFIDRTSFSLKEENISLKENETIKINVVASNNDKSYTLTYSSNNINVATVDENGLVTALKEGTATILITNNLNRQVIFCNIKVIKENIPITKITLNKTKLTLKKEEVVKLTPTIIPIDATNKNLTWFTTNSKVATVKNGVIIAIDVGVAEITVKGDGKTATCKVTVIEIVSGITLNIKASSIYIGETLSLKATLTPSTASNKSIVWATNNSSVASVNNGVVKGLKTGTAVITAKTVDGGFTASATIEVINSIKIHFIKQQSNSSDAILLESNGHYAMIDTGLETAVDRSKMLDYLKSLKINVLDFILITHNHYDHIGGGPSIINSGITVKKVYIKTYLCNDDGCSDAQKRRYNEFITAALTKKIPITYLESLNEGYNFNLDKMNITLYNTVQIMAQAAYKGKNENNNSVVQLIKIGNINTFLGADSYTSAILSPIINKVGDVSVVKIPHHAYSTCGVTDSGASKLNPEHLIITNSVERLGGSYVKCVTHFNNNIPRYFTGDMNHSVIVDYSSGSVNVLKN